jgi:hypothetical protein
MARTHLHLGSRQFPRTYSLQLQNKGSVVMATDAGAV